MFAAPPQAKKGDRNNQRHGLAPLFYSLNSLNGGNIGDDIGDYHRVIEGDTRSLDYSSLLLLRSL